ncbi:hypothetical protein UACE39S_05337 [Ureibacillus acetophenoni]|uniref:hypothetical protein n=1 Tax=Ureibacillus sp. MALMAid1270 TaxID=3411629 RepID=UPI003BA55A0C
MNIMNEIKANSLSEYDRMQLKKEIIMLLEKCSKEEIEGALIKLKNKDQSNEIA